MPRTSPRKSKTPEKQEKPKSKAKARKGVNDMETNDIKQAEKVGFKDEEQENSPESDVEDNDVSNSRLDKSNAQAKAKISLTRRRTTSASGTTKSEGAFEQAKQSPPKIKPGLQAETTRIGQCAQILVLVFIAFVMVATIYGGGNEATAFRRQATRRYLNIQSDNTAFNREAKTALETFQGDLKHDKYLGTIKHAKVLQIESLPQHFGEVERVVNDIFPASEFDRVIIDGSDRDARLNGDFFAPFNPTRPLLVLVANSHRASSSLLRSLAHSMSSPVLEANGRTRSPHNVGFLILGTSLSSDGPCKSLNLLEHDRDTLGWSPTFLTRITDQAKVC